VSTKRAAPSKRPEPGRWRILRSNDEMGSFQTEEMARQRFYSLRRSAASQGAKLIRPGGTVAEE
jgi:hypothetical protein